MKTKKEIEEKRKALIIEKNKIQSGSSTRIKFNKQINLLDWVLKN